MGQVFDRKLRVAFDLISERLGADFKRILVVGCGPGVEAVALHHRFGSEVVGIDLDGSAFVTTPPAVQLLVADAADIPFPDDSFDLIYSFHALEHIEGLEAALDEMRRVLSPAGGIFWGTPNKRRIVGYIGSDTSFQNKLKWNVDDWRRRIAGGWENHLGAHAGFTRAELMALAATRFGQVHDRTFEYYEKLYASRRHWIRRLRAWGLDTYLFPAVYVSS